MYKIIVNCEENDRADIRCGGPLFLGFDFFVKKDPEKVKKYIEDKLKENNLSYISIEIIDYGIPRAWTLQEIKECIKKGYK